MISVVIFLLVLHTTIQTFYFINLYMLVIDHLAVFSKTCVIQIINPFTDRITLGLQLLILC